MAFKGKKKKGTVLDFTGVKSGGGRTVEDGKYHAKVEECEEKEGSDSGQPYFAFQWKILEKGSAKGAIVYDNVSLQPQALWRLKGLLETLGEEVPDGAMELDTADLLGKECVIEITTETYNGKPKARITGFEPLGAETEETDSEEEEEEEEEEKPKKTNKLVSKLKVGSKVTFTDDDEKTIKGKITKIEDETATVEDSSGDDWEVELSDLTAV